MKIENPLLNKVCSQNSLSERLHFDGYTKGDRTLQPKAFNHKVLWNDRLDSVQLDNNEIGCA
ncbi:MULTISPECIES: hypothetical protein [Nostoc cyanobionts]|uniref:hypothetical protein n=1 Tax=Nostoc cyanobionts TaxID=3123326 RepID=UPI00117EE154|nr:MULTISPECIES: hypothetical protein [unclassified Nostoc]